MAIAVQFRLRNIKVKYKGRKRINSTVVFSTMNRIWARAGNFFYGSITEELTTDSTFWGVVDIYIYLRYNLVLHNQKDQMHASPLQCLSVHFNIAWEHMDLKEINYCLIFSFTKQHSTIL